MDPGTSAQVTGGPPYFLMCPGCKWSSKEVGWLFDKPSAIAREWIQLLCASVSASSTSSSGYVSTDSEALSVSIFGSTYARTIHWDDPAILWSRLWSLNSSLTSFDSNCALCSHSSPWTPMSIFAVPSNVPLMPRSSRSSSTAVAQSRLFYACPCDHPADFLSSVQYRLEQ